MKDLTRRSAWLMPAILLIGAAGVVLSAQQPPKQTPRPTPTPQTPKFRIATDVVRTDVRVNDATGHFIPDLTIKDFEVYEDGVLQKITNFVAMIGGRALTEIESVKQTETEGLILPKSAKPPSGPGRIFIIFIDDLHLQPKDTPLVKQALKQIRDNLIHENDLVGLVSSGYSSISVDLSPDPRHLRFDQAIEKTMGAGKTYQEIVQAQQTMEGPSGLRQDAFVAFKTAYEILDQAEKVTDRRKAFIYVSSGYDFNPFTESRYQYQKDLYDTVFGAGKPVVDQGQTTGSGSDPLTAMASNQGQVLRNPFEMNGLQFSFADLARSLAELVRRARRAGVVFYPVDPRGLIAGPGMDMNGISQSDYASYVTNTLSSLDVIAGETGGKCICRTNDIKKGLQIVDSEMSDYYVVGYESNNPDPLKIRRHIEIKVKRAGAQKPIYVDSYTIKR